ncbi:hypothetical protein [Burkholderia stagnalis]|uniref:Uncharacterized protein n=1 Tax=Burkholderia stagnalis TaxID=1503054 RepID=A0A6L3MM47_9BURK|nr:hypothetical protein [Burkholderia stagnalis]KAB0632305.1 hypothetical protein F7R25_33660 [Burkholderia stagnalis]
MAMRARRAPPWRRFVVDRNVETGMPPPGVAPADRSGKFYRFCNRGEEEEPRALRAAARARVQNI